MSICRAMKIWIACPIALVIALSGFVSFLVFNLGEENLAGKWVNGDEVLFLDDDLYFRYWPARDGLVTGVVGVVPLTGRGQVSGKTLELPLKFGMRDGAAIELVKYLRIERKMGSVVLSDGTGSNEGFVRIGPVGFLCSEPTGSERLRTGESRTE